MRKRQKLLISTSLILLFAVFLGACKRAGSRATPTSLITPSVAQSQEVALTASASPQSTLPVNAPQTGIPYPLPTVEIGYPNPVYFTPTPYPAPLASVTRAPTLTPKASQTQRVPSPSPTGTETELPGYPGPGVSPTITPLYPGPQITNTSAPYPGPATSTPRPTQTPSKSLTPTTLPSETNPPSPTPTAGTGTPGLIPTELPPRPPLSPPPPGSTVTIWHSWGITETETLKGIIQSFQRINPNVTFSLLYVPLDDLYSTYQEAAYLGQGPSLLLGPSKWGPELFDENLIIDLNPYVPVDYLTSINPAALSSGEYLKSLISLPLSQRGMVMFRNTTLISTAAKTFDELNTLAHDVTHGGVVGSYLERGSYFSAANILGLGGRLMDENENPAFNDAFGLEWFNLLSAYDTAGAVTFNTNRDLDMFKRGRVGIIIDGSWNISLLSQSIGADNLAIDPWPTYGTGHMSGWVESDSIFLNANTTGDDRFAALSFIGYLLDPNVQLRLAEVGHIPSVINVEPRDNLLQQAMVAFSNGSPYPIALDESVLSLYWKEIDTAIRKVFVSGINPADALKAASNDLLQIMADLQATP